jgi:hypothetical protein
MADNPLLGAVAGVTAALVLGLAVDVVARRVLGRPREATSFALSPRECQ